MVDKSKILKEPHDNFESTKSPGAKTALKSRFGLNLFTQLFFV